MWQAREAGLGATAHHRGEDAWPGWEDSAVHPDDLGGYLRDLRDLLHDFDLQASVYGHFGDGCVHCRINFDLTSPDGVAHYRRFLSAAAELCVDYGGSLSGEHGDGQQRGPLLETMFGPGIVQAFREFKGVFDPDGAMNPGKVVDPADVDEHLRLGASHREWHPETTFAYPDDGFDFNRAQKRCVGVGKCRRDDGAGTMCPSYMVTKEEQHSTRGRARMLFEMLQPDSELDGWQDESVREALDLCLSCKGCVTDCPVDVDMATYKAEFLHHHYEDSLHPRVHYAMGLIDVWSRLGSVLPGIANRLLEAPVVGPALKRAAGVARPRPAPGFAARTFRRWFHDRRSDHVPEGAPRVVLFPDTFVNHFEPAVGRATVSVLEDAGYRVELPDRQLCCGRPLYDYGFLDRAQRYLDRLVGALSGPVADGAKVVGMEPSCVAVFRDELLNLRPHDEDARRLADATMTLGEFLTGEADYDFPRLARPAVVHGHCHHKGSLGLSGMTRALDALGLDWEELDAGCCGMAGSFGFEAGEKYDVSVRAGERRLLPAVRDTDPGTLVVADGFSCRTQVTQLQEINGTGGGPRRRPLHLAQVIRMARATGPQGPDGPGPVEDAWLDADAGDWSWRDTAAVGAAGAGLAASLWRAYVGD